MEFETVLPVEVEHGGMRCEACDRELEVGDEYVPAMIAFAGVTLGEVCERFGLEAEEGREDDPVPVFGEHRCRECFEAGREVDGE